MSAARHYELFSGDVVHYNEKYWPERAGNDPSRRVLCSEGTVALAAGKRYTFPTGTPIGLLAAATALEISGETILGVGLGLLMVYLETQVASVLHERDNEAQN